MYDQNAAELIGTIAEAPRFKKTENTNRSKIDFVMKIHRLQSPNSYDRIYVTAWEDLADQVKESYGQGDRIAVKGKINVSSYKAGEQNRYYTRVIADEVSVPKEEKGKGFGYVKVPEEKPAEQNA
ncbi:MAG: single-stranded DNA-binding protein [Erysipelotrichaceae bacterium]|jgi:single-stranded DNA-binding protein|nr:single-stranded DNA-binding protein [Erysipelotrichaceae bacterium]